MNKKDLWDRFIQSGKISDYLDYKKKADNEYADDMIDEEAADEFHIDYPEGTDKYDGYY